MSYLPNELSITSTIGVNSDTVISGGNWVGNTYTGAGEENDFAYVGVNLQVDEAGTLFFDFSQDGTNWSTYPVNGFTIASGINEVHTAWKGGRYMRPRFIGDDGSRTYFRLKTYYSNLPLPLSAPLNQSIGADQDATVVRSVGIGEDPTGTYTNVKTDGAAFTTTANLTSGSTYDSGVINIQNYNQVQTNLVSDKDGTIEFIFGSSDTMAGNVPGTSGVERVVTVPYSAADGFQLYSAPAFTPYVRYTFTNDGTDTTTQLFFETKLLTKALSGQVLGANAFISPNMVANLGRNIIVGQNAAGTFSNVPVDSTNNLKVRIDEPKTGFGQISVAEETTIIAQQFPYAINPRVVTTTLASSATVTQADSQAVLSTGTSANGSAVMETREVMKYQPGTGSVVRFTAAFTTGIADNHQIVGYGDDTDGFFIGYNGSTFSILRRQNGSDNWTALSAANIDHLDGAGDANNPSNILLDPTKGNVFQIRFQWLGYGAIVFSLEDENTGDFEPFHIIKYANNFVVPSIYAPALPIRWENTNTNGNATDIVLKSASAMAALEGERKFTGPTFSNNETGVTANHVFSIRNDSSNVLGGVNTNRHSIFIKGFSVANDGTSTSTYTLELNTPITTPSFTKVNNLESIVSVDTAGTLGAAGDILGTFSVAKNQSLTEKLFDVNDLIELRPGDTLSVRCSNTNSTDAGLSWIEDI